MKIYCGEGEGKYGNANNFEEPVFSYWKLILDEWYLKKNSDIMILQYNMHIY